MTSVLKRKRESNNKRVMKKYLSPFLAVEPPKLCFG